jgi:hypothetical protein
MAGDATHMADNNKLDERANHPPGQALNNLAAGIPSCSYR